ncbi:ribbon-helix-helix domain-containing protein [Leptospira interrogans]
MAKTDGAAVINKRIAFKAEVLHAIALLARERGLSLQDLADEAFADLLKKHHRPVGLQAALKASLRTLPANDQPQGRKRR